MPESFPTPNSGLITRWVLENPWPLGGLAILAALIIGWLGLRDGLTRHTRVAAGLATFGIIILLIGTLVTTSGERAVAVTGELVKAAVAGDTQAAAALFSDNASMSFGRPDGPGVDFSQIRRRLDMLAGQYRIESNTIMSIKGFTEKSDTGIVHLSCLTEVEAGYGPTPSTWVLRVKKQPDGEWLISRITMVSVAGQTGVDVMK